ncbi:MAG: response regulator [Cellvibrionales bacterium]|jgi:two-component system chemotaxis response regulator CheY|nr:response regulator [Cellvibrionales bacterium]HRF88324.1 response regulator [Pseudomonadales bacterium]HRG50279.1 response regulator [Pseudomonadales bacterium]
MKMLIVDDSTVMQRKIQRSITLEQVSDFFTASNGVEAVEVFKREMPELVTMDLTMPEMDGVECVQHLVAIKPDVLILVISSLSDKATTIQAMKNGAKGFLTKPFDDEQINAALEELIEEAQG